VVIVGKDFYGLRNELLKEYLPGKILQSALNENSNFPMLSGKNAGNETLIFLCRQYTCKTPVFNIEALVKQIKEE
jgi:uncharacterized protein YyaL (SSP411 family)